MPSSPDAEPTLRGYAGGQRVFGRYTLRHMLGRGGMGVVWHARDETLGGDVALKFLPDAVRWDPGAYDDLKAETRRARLLTHPNIVRIHDFVEDAGAAAISMELVEGATLTALRLAKPNKVFEPADIAPWLPQLCAALDYAHTQAQVVHRDLKPANLMLTAAGVLKVADFGVARSMADSISRTSMMSAGTLAYMSPQQAMGGEPAVSDDLYALGATLYELLAGKPPFHTGDVRLQLFQRKPDSIGVRRRMLPAVDAAPREIPRTWEKTIAACLAKNADERPRSATEVAARLCGDDAGGVRSSRVSKGGMRVGLGRIGRSRAAWVGAALTVVLTGWGAFSGMTRYFRNAAERAFPSDATRALAAWNFDGDGRDASGRGFHGDVGVAVPTTDRFGRIDRALRFNGRAAVAVPDAPQLRWGGKQPFTAAVWLWHEEPEDRTGMIWSSIGEDVGSLSWSLGLINGAVGAAFQGNHGEFNDQVVLRGGERLAPREWHHLALTSDGVTARLHLDGVELVARALAKMADCTTPRKVDLRFAQSARLDPWALLGTLDDARLWRRALTVKEIAALADHNLPSKLLLTNGTYTDSDDLLLAIRAEYGERARLADWNELKRWHADDTFAWADQMGITVAGPLVWLQRGGQRLLDGKRHYLMNRFDGVKPYYYDAHDELGGMRLALGSWYGVSSRVLVTLPAAMPHIENLALGTDGRIRREGALGEGVSAIELRWRIRLTARPGESGPTATRLRTSGGREWRAVCQPADSGGLGLAVGDRGPNERTRQVAATFGECDFVLVVRAGELRFRATSAVGGTLLFQETTTVEGLNLAEIREIDITAGADSGLTGARLIIE